jgi:rubrerythrin
MTDEHQSRVGERSAEILGRISSESSRRSFLAKSVGVGAGALALGGPGITSSALAHSGDGEVQDGDQSQVDVLNYALTLEMLEATFYTRGLEEFAQSDIEGSEVAAKLGDRTRYDLYEFLGRIRDHEQAHVDALTKTIEDLGGEPVSGVEFEFGYESAPEFLATAQALENTGVSAYDGAINLLEDDALLTAAATIATVEGRHASYLNLVNGEVPFPRAFDKALPMDEVLEIANQFIVQE